MIRIKTRGNLQTRVRFPRFERLPVRPVEALNRVSKILGFKFCNAINLKYLLPAILLLIASASMAAETASPTNTETIPTVVASNAGQKLATNAAPSETTNALVEPASSKSSLDVATDTTFTTNQLHELQSQLDLGREQRRAKSTILAGKTLVGIMETNAPAEYKRLALFELAMVAQEGGQPVKAQQIFSQYLIRYPDDQSVPEVLLREGLLYRQMGVTTLAISKFYAVMSSALKLKLENMDYYKKLVLQAQMEIADTYYLEGKYSESSDFFNRLLKAEMAESDKTQIQYKLIRSLSNLTNHTETVAKAQVYLEFHPNTTETPEVRFLLASALKKLGRNQDAMKQVLLLLQSQEENVRKNPEMWIYWQQRAGNDIANQLYKDGDYLSSLAIYLTLADLDKSPAWQLPVWYQSALVYEQLQQWQKASEMYTRIMDRQKELTDANNTPTLKSLLEMSKWRKDYLSWMEKAKVTNLTFERRDGTNSSAAAVTQ